MEGVGFKPALMRHAKLHHCAGAGYYIARNVKTCIDCRRAAALDRLKEYAAERSEDRADARLEHNFRCKRCGRAIPLVKKPPPPQRSSERAT